MTTEPNPGIQGRVRGQFVRFAVTAGGVFLLWAAPVALLTPPDVYNVIYLAPGVLLGLLLGFHVAYRDGFSWVQ